MLIGGFLLPCCLAGLGSAESTFEGGWLSRIPAQESISCPPPLYNRSTRRKIFLAFVDLLPDANPARGLRVPHYFMQGKSAATESFPVDCCGGPASSTAFSFHKHSKIFKRESCC